MSVVNWINNSNTLQMNTIEGFMQDNICVSQSHVCLLDA